ncbi:MAG TPA: hypothetical protein VN892_02515, partial [Solirubrobacteraceae bacterium]|nr:hypothetical protein [Solirubrobacteraceae bacterium]
LVISRNCTLAAITPPGRVAISITGLRRQHHHPWLSKPANVAGEPTSQEAQILERALCPRALFDDDYETFIKERSQVLAIAAQTLIGPRVLAPSS